MKHPRQRRQQRVHRWEGVVEDVDHDSFWARLIPTDHTGPEVGAEIDLARLPDAYSGMLFNLYVHRRGRKYRAVLRERDFGCWTAEELATIRARARVRAERVRQLVE